MFSGLNITRAQFYLLLSASTQKVQRKAARAADISERNEMTKYNTNQGWHSPVQKPASNAVTKPLSCKRDNYKGCGNKNGAWRRTNLEPDALIAPLEQLPHSNVSPASASSFGRAIGADAANYLEPIDLSE